MKAMVLAAGLGTRLRPITDERPKALVEVNGRSLLEITLARLRSFGVREVIINVHHFADMVVDYLRANNNFGLQIEISREDVLLDTGGGLKKAAPFFLNNSADPDEPFIVHNVDIVSTIDLARMLRFHTERHALATLAVHERNTSRYLIFDDQLQLCGRRAGRDCEPEIVRLGQPMRPLAFTGIHVISPHLLPMLTEEGIFPILPSYLRIAAQGGSILAFRADEYYWRDVGNPESLEQTARDFQNHTICG